MATSLINRTRSIQLARSVEFAFSIKARVIGLLGRDSLEPERALWIRPCNSVHSWFMRFAIDVVFVDRQLRVKKVVSTMRPWQIVFPVWGAHSCFELAAGQISSANIQVGDQLDVGT